MISALERMRAGKVLVGVGSMLPAGGVVDKLGPDWDFIWFDMQHGQHDYRSVLEGVRIADAYDMAPFVRVPGHDSGWICRAIDTAAAGIIVPQIDTADQARAVVAAAKFPPVGERSYGGRRPIDRSGRGYAHSANDQVAVVVQIESRLALDNIDEILDVDGVDCCFFGPDDMALRDGLRMDEPRSLDRLLPFMKQVAEAAKRHGCAAGGVFASPDAFSHAVELGFQLISAGGDHSFLQQRSKEVSAGMRKLLEQPETPAKSGTDAPSY